MNAAIRGTLVEALEELGRRFPHWRFGQLVCNVAGWADADVWDAEDEQLLDALRTQAAFEQTNCPTPAVPCPPAEGSGSPRVGP
jgi:hypothetical protein